MSFKTGSWFRVIGGEHAGAIGKLGDFDILRDDFDLHECVGSKWSSLVVKAMHAEPWTPRVGESVTGTGADRDLHKGVRGEITSLHDAMNGPACNVRRDDGRLVPMLLKDLEPAPPQPPSASEVLPECAACGWPQLGANHPNGGKGFEAALAYPSSGFEDVHRAPLCRECSSNPETADRIRARRSPQPSGPGAVAASEAQGEPTREWFEGAAWLCEKIDEVAAVWSSGKNEWVGETGDARFQVFRGSVSGRMPSIKQHTTFGDLRELCRGSRFTRAQLLTQASQRAGGSAETGVHCARCGDETDGVYGYGKHTLCVDCHGRGDLVQWSRDEEQQRKRADQAERDARADELDRELRKLNGPAQPPAPSAIEAFQAAYEGRAPVETDPLWARLAVRRARHRAELLAALNKPVPQRYPSAWSTATDDGDT